MRLLKLHHMYTIVNHDENANLQPLVLVTVLLDQAIQTREFKGRPLQDYRVVVIL